MSAYVRYYRRLQALTQRLSTYLDRLEARAREFGVSSARTAMEMQITDPASVSAFRSEVEAQIMFLHTKAQRVFAKHFAPFLDIDADLSIDEDRQLSARLQDAANLVGGFEMRLRNIIEEVFAPGRAEQAREEWNRAMTDWRQAQFSFTCDKCGDPVPLPELYHMPVFITCPRCKSRVAFQPTEAMAAAPTWAKEVAKTTCYAEWQKSESEQAAEEGVGLAFFYYVDYAIAHHLMMNRLLPFYVRSQGGQEALRRDVRKALETRTHQLRPDEVSPQYHAMEYVNFMGGLGRSAQILGQEGLDDRRQLILQTVRDIMRPDEPLARSILDNTFTEELWSQQAHAADQLSCEVPR